MDTLGVSQPLFGTLVKKARAEKEIGLREFCLHLDLDPGNWSKIERGILQPPSSEDLLDRIAALLELSSGDRQNLSDFSNLDRKEIPQDIAEDQYILKMLPAFMRTVRETKPTDEDMDTLLQLIREDYAKRIKSANNG